MNLCTPRNMSSSGIGDSEKANETGFPQEPRLREAMVYPRESGAGMTMKTFFYRGFYSLILKNVFRCSVSDVQNVTIVTFCTLRSCKKYPLGLAGKK